MHLGALTLIQYTVFPYKVRVCPVKEGRVFGIVYKIFLTYFIQDQFDVFISLMQHVM